MTSSEGRKLIGSRVTLDGLCVGYGRTDILRDINLSVSAGEFVALLGPSGCGKTTFLRAIAGFISLRKGRILLNERNIAAVPPERRGTAMMFQSYALWPHMTVAQNVGYGLRLQGKSRDDTARKVNDILNLVGLRDFIHRRPGALSGGQRQRVALARALAIDPPVLLLDEPLSNLDAGIRATMRHEIRSLQQRMGLTAILVTHDQTEALTMADRIVVLKDGHIAQTGTPEEVYHRPTSTYVARFMGAENELPVVMVEKDGEMVPRLATSKEAGRRRFRLMFRSGAARIAPAGSSGLEGFRASGAVRQSSYLGSVYRHTLDVCGHQVMVDHPERIHVGTAADMCVPAAGFNLFDMESTAATGSEAEPKIESNPNSREKHYAT